MSIDIDKNPAWFRVNNRCAITNLPVFHPDIYVSRHDHSNYIVEMAKLGDRFFLVKASGYVRSFEMIESTRYMDGYISKHFDKKYGLVWIEDYTSVEGADSKARKIYIQYLKGCDLIIGGVLYNQSILFKISFNLAKKLHVYDEIIYSVATYAQAVSLAVKILSQEKPDQEICREDVILTKNMESSTFSVKCFDNSIRFFNRLISKFKLFVFAFTNKLQDARSRLFYDELLSYIESIDWKKEGSQSVDGRIYASKSFRQVIDAISYIKSELDTLFCERNRAEQVLKESESRYRQLVEHANAGILEFDYHTNEIISANDSLAKITGYSKEEILSMNPIDFLTAESRKKFSNRLSRLFSGEAISQEIFYQIVTKNAEEKWVILNTNITYKDKQPRKANVVITDITKLKSTEEKLLKYQSQLKQLSIQLSKSEENQRRNLASQLHDRVSQELFVAQLQINSLGTSLDSPELLRQLNQIKEQLVKIIKETKTLTFDLSPPVLYDFGLKEAIETLSASIESKYNLSVKTNFLGDMDNIDEDIKIIFYRNINELIHNAVKHARAGNISIRIKNSQNILDVKVEDDGVGFNTDNLFSKARSYDGFGLFDIKEKINHLGGHLDISSEPGSGTSICMAVPLL